MSSLDVDNATLSTANASDPLVPTYSDKTPIVWDGNNAHIAGALYEVGRFYANDDVRRISGTVEGVWQKYGHDMVRSDLERPTICQSFGRRGRCRRLAHQRNEERGIETAMMSLKVSFY